MMNKSLEKTIIFKRILRALGVCCLIVLLLLPTVVWEVKIWQIQRLTGSWVPQAREENFHTFFPDGYPDFVPWGSDHGGWLDCISLYQNGTAIIDISYDTDEANNQKWQMTGTFVNHWGGRKHLLIRLTNGVDRYLYCRYLIMHVDKDYLVLQKADDDWNGLGVSEYLERL